MKQSDKQKKTCTVCQKSKVVDRNFYESKSPLFDGTINICTPCVRKQIDYSNMETIYSFLRQIDVPFDYNVWQSAVKSSRETIGSYMSQCNLGQMVGKTWNDSVFAPETNMPSSKTITTPSIEEEFVLTDEIIERWGVGFEPEMYRYFEKKYAFIKKNYSEKTSMHTEALQSYVIYKVRAELATAKGHVGDAKKWNDMANVAAEAAKINPSQLTKTDLSDGIDSFSTLVREVEKAVDIIPILPKFKEQPKDRVDFTIWCYVNYIRDLKGLPLADYSDIYKFYEDFKGMYEDRIEDLQGDIDERDME